MPATRAGPGGDAHDPHRNDGPGGQRLSAGNTSSVKWFSGIGEIRIDSGPGYRVYLAKDGEALILLFCGGAKKRQQADIEAALALHAEYKRRKKSATRKAR